MISKRRPELRHKRAIAGSVLYFWERLAKTSKVLETNSAKKNCDVKRVIAVDQERSVFPPSGPAFLHQYHDRLLVFMHKNVVKSYEGLF